MSNPSGNAFCKFFLTASKFLSVIGSAEGIVYRLL